VSKSYSFASYAIEAGDREPFRLDVPGKVGVSEDTQIVIPCPDVDVIFEIEEATTTRERLRLYCGEQYGEVRKLLKGKHAETLTRLVSAMARHFEVDDSGN
jgi:hypothetical protein